MSMIELRVELPAYSHSFSVPVPLQSTVLDVKHAINRTCPGAPRVEGQRLIYRGRFLNDTESVQDLWKSPEESPIVHLSVHPSAWTSAPPRAATSVSQPATTDPTSLLAEALGAPMPPEILPSLPATPPSAAVLSAAPLTYVIFRHNNALLALMQRELVPLVGTEEDVRQLRQRAINAVQDYGFQWPSVLDTEFPAPQNETQGIKYERIAIQNGQYLNLVTPDAAPTPMQSHALQVLTYTFPLLSLSLPNIRSQTSITAPPEANVQHLNHHLRELGLPPLRVDVQEIPVRALMVPIITLAFRTLFLLYFFSPTKKPMFAFMVGVWMLYEAWGAVRAALGGEGARDQDGRPRGAVRGAPAGGAAGNRNGAGAAPAVNAAGGLRAIPRPSNSDVILNNIAEINLSTEERMVSAAEGAPEPPFMHKLKMFVFLFFATLHPAVWDQRRKLLRRREGRLRTEMNALEARNGEGEGGETPEDRARAQARTQLAERHARRPRWLREYVDRVRSGDWVDD